MRIPSTFLIGCFVFLCLTGCVSYEQLVNYGEDFPNPPKVEINNPPDIRIKANDVLGIKVFCSETALAAPFNMSFSPQGDNYMSLESMQLSGYLVGEEGGIDFPVLGYLKLEGMTISEAKDFLIEQLKAHLKDPVVNLRLLNFRVTVSGEVRNPGSFHIVDERVSLPDALAFAGDLTDYADRRNILLVREEGGVRRLEEINLQSAGFFKSEFYYLKQNDLIYVRPLKSKAGAIQDQTVKTVSVLSAAATMAAVLVALFKGS